MHANKNRAKMLQNHNKISPLNPKDIHQRNIVYVYSYKQKFPDVHKSSLPCY